MFVCQNHGVRSGLFFSQLENRDVFVSCTVRNNAVELTVSAFLELNDVDKTLIFPIIELEELVFQKASKERYHIVCERGTQDGISRVMGKKLIDFKDMNNTPMPAHKYDDYGIRRDGINPLTHSGYWEEEQ